MRLLFSSPAAGQKDKVNFCLTSRFVAGMSYYFSAIQRWHLFLHLFMVLGYPKLSHFMKNYSSTCSHPFLLLLSPPSSVTIISWWLLIKYSSAWPQPVSPWELLSLCRCWKTREIVKSRTSNSLRNCQLLSAASLMLRQVPGVYWWLMPGGEAAATDGEFCASFASLSIPLPQGQVLFWPSRLLNPKNLRMPLPV